MTYRIQFSSAPECRLAILLARPAVTSDHLGWRGSSPAQHDLPQELQTTEVSPQVDPCHLTSFAGTPDEYRRAVDRAERGQP